MKKIVIIGAGPAGLTCAYQLLKKNKNCKVTVLEEENSVGGISRTILHRGNRMDLGGHRFFTKNEDVMKFWLSLLPLQGKPAYDDRILKIVKDYQNGKKNPEKEDDVMSIKLNLVWNMKEMWT